MGVARFDNPTAAKGDSHFLKSESASTLNIYGCFEGL
jgi:hypothetical protein